MKKITLLTVLGLFLFSQAAYAGWGQEQGGREGRGNRRGENFIQSLNLTPEQQQKLQEHRQQTRQKREEIRDAVNQKKKEVHGILQDPNFNEAQARQISGEINELTGQLSDLRIDGVLYMRSVLTPEQYFQFSQKMRKAHQKRKGKRNNCR